MALDILIVDDENDIRELVTGVLGDEGYNTRSAGSYIEAIEEIQKKSPNLIILDVWLGEGERDGLRILDLIKESHGHVQVIMISGHGTIETAILAMKKGACDFIEKPFDSSRLIASVEKAMEIAKLKKENAELKVMAKVSENILGQSKSIFELKREVEKIAPMGGRIVILGSAGSDKEAVAREIHKLSPRAKNPFESLNCLFFTANQLEIKLFGISTNSSGEMRVEPGVLEKVSGGTLFINDLSKASSDIQTKMLKTLKEGFFSRIGSNEKILFDVRIISGFPYDIDELIKKGEFSDELFSRLNASTLRTTPLSHRVEDIMPLIDYYMEQSSKTHNVQPRKFTKEAVGILNSYSWPGDVMQLKNFIDWMITINLSSDASVVTVDDLPKDIIEEAVSPLGNSESGSVSNFLELSIRDARDKFEKCYFREQQKRFHGNITKIAQFSGMERSALHRKLSSLNITDSRNYRIIKKKQNSD